MLDPNRELDLFNAGYDQEGDASGLSLIVHQIKRTMPKPDQDLAETMARAGYAYYCMECDAMDDGARLPYRPK